LPEEFGNLTKVKHLNLSKNKFSTIPLPLLKLTSLNELFLYENQISNINIPFGGFKKLGYLVLSDNKIRSLPDQITSCQTLESLNLSGNHFKDPVKDLKILSKLSNLYYLRIADCGIKEIPTEILKLDKLYDLDLSKNEINDMQAVKKKLSKMRALTYLNVQDNVVPATDSVFFSLNFLLRLVAFLLGLFLLYNSFFLYKNEQGTIENKINSFWKFMAEKNTDYRGFSFWISTFKSVSKSFFNKMFSLKFNSLQSWGVIFALNSCFLSFYYLTNISTDIHKNNFLSPNYLFVLGFFALALCPVYFRTFNKFILITCILLVALFALVTKGEGPFAFMLFFSTTMLCISSLLTFFYFKLLDKFILTRGSTTAGVIGLVFHIAIVYLFIKAILTLPVLFFFSKWAYYLLLAALTLNTIFITSFFVLVFYLILILHHLLERSSYLIIEQKVLSNKKIAIPLGIILLVASSFLPDSTVEMIKKITALF
jgi:hypothetical protein